MWEVTDEHIDSIEGAIDYIGSYEEYVSELSYEIDNDKGVVTISYRYYEGCEEDCDCEECSTCEDCQYEIQDDCEYGCSGSKYDEDEIEYKSFTISSEEEYAEFRESPRDYLERHTD